MLLFDSNCKGMDGFEVVYVEDILNGELIVFDEIDVDMVKDFFVFFSGFYDSYMNNFFMLFVRLEVLFYVFLLGMRFLNFMICFFMFFIVGFYMVGD